MGNREFDALYPRRETGFESSYDFVDLDFPFYEGDVFEMENDLQGKEVETDGRASEADRGSAAQHA